MGLPTLGMLLVSRRSDGTTVLLDGPQIAAGDCPSPSPSHDDEFCTRWRDYLDWARGQGDDITREKATEIVTRFQDMRPVAPAEMVPHVDAVITTYATYAVAPEPFQVPLSGQTAFAMYQALLAIDGYCGTNAFPT